MNTTTHIHNGRIVSRTSTTNYLRALLLAAIAAGTLALVSPARADTHCKGIAQEQCTGAKACRWMPARVAGELSPRTQKPYARGAKAHCRLDVKRAGEIASKQ